MKGTQGRRDQAVSKQPKDLPARDAVEGGEE
jgi:hypothetical protein